MKKLTYSVPVNLQKDLFINSFVQVPLQNRIVPAIVIEIIKGEQKYHFSIKEIDSIIRFPDDKNYNDFIEKVSYYSQTNKSLFFKRIQSFLNEKEIKTVESKGGKDQKIISESVFTEEQKTAYYELSNSLTQDKFDPFLLHGVTGSGKTEIYKKLVIEILSQGKSAILMLPEVSLALQFENIFKSVLSNFSVIGFHSATTVKNKRRLWSFLVDGKPLLIIGVHLPILLPISNLGLIIVDEEHEQGYQEKKHPKINSREIAILRASIEKIPILLGSATPSLQSVFNIKKRGWKYLELKNRYAGKFPEVEIVSLKNKEKRSSFWITETVRLEIKNRLNRKEQTILFLNRRGHSFFVQCKCSYVFRCKNCSVSLTLHNDNSLVCHYCGYKEMMPQICPDCKKASKNFIKKGVGTQQIVNIISKIFPSAVIARADADATVKKRSWQKTVEDMVNGDIDILVGTQSVTKGYHFPRVTLVAVLWADLQLHFPVYNAIEVALQQLLQVAGRAGRELKNGKIIVQVFDNHSVYDYLDERKYLNFCEQEISKRAELSYPPVSHVAEIEIRNKYSEIAEQDAERVAALIQSFIDSNAFDISILGPVSAIVYRVKGVYAQKIILKSVLRIQMIKSFNFIDKDSFSSSLFFTMDPIA